MDAQIIGLRPLSWGITSSAISAFQKFGHETGGEREKVGAILFSIREGFNNPDHKRKISRLFTNSNSTGGFELEPELTIRQNTISDKDEKEVGADFLMSLQFQSKTVSFLRIALFQAKLVDGSKVRIDIEQLDKLLLSSPTHSFYLFFVDEPNPRCIPAWLIKSHLQTLITKNPQRSGVRRPTIDWHEIKHYSMEYASLIGNYFFAGELGELHDPAIPLNKTVTKIAGTLGVSNIRLLSFRFSTEETALEGMGRDQIENMGQNQMEAEQ